MNTNNIIQDSLKLATTHYENFPVASMFLPLHLREPIALIYSFARQADDFADEGDLTQQERLDLLGKFKTELDSIFQGQTPQTEFFVSLKKTILENDLPIQPFYDLLDAFSQDVVKKNYANFGELMDYCRRSANPIGRLMLHLYKEATPKNIGYSDAICSSLQLINFLQDVVIDNQKNRNYFPQDEMLKYKVSQEQIDSKKADINWNHFMEFQINRARQLLQSGAPLGIQLKGRIGLEMRTIIAGGACILKKLHQSRGDIFASRPKLTKKDWVYMFYRAVLKR